MEEPKIGKSGKGLIRTGNSNNNCLKATKTWNVFSNVVIYAAL